MGGEYGNMRRSRGFLIDLDGTVYLKEKEIEGSFEFIKGLQTSKLPYRFLTNTASKTLEEIRDNLLKMGLEVKESKILNPISIADQYLKSQEIKGYYFSGDLKIRNQISNSYFDETNPQVVILGDMQKICSYQELNKIYKFLLNGADLLTTSYSDYFISPLGQSIDTGSFARMFENLTGKRAKILGKPSELFYQMALESMGLSNTEVAAVGDDIETDIKGAKEQGIYSILVKTGKYNLDSVAKSNIRPDMVIDKLGDLIRFI